MPIAALSENAARAICSTLVLNDAISIIKEMIDNALDSNASNIMIEVSANTLDVIQVKDNGAGIGVEDRQLLCKRGYTSKIRTFEDLTQLGGTFLGFRGEALASVAELSESVTFTTRIDGETVGTLLKFNSKGKLTSSSSAAHGTGTTVRVSDFLKSIPVRRQTALKQATKTLNSIKRLLFDYAFARPTVRFQFKVLKSGGDLKANWSFAPCKDASNLNILASKIVGKEIAAQCTQATVTSDGGDSTIDALLFAQDADISKCGGAERFISIDGRPLTVERGLMKEFNKIYKSYISSALRGDTSLPNKIFLLLRLQFPRGSYDVNVEPAKNEVMFEDSELVLDLFERLCKATYGEKTSHPSARRDASRKKTDAVGDFDFLLAKKPPGPHSGNKMKELSEPSLNSKEASDSGERQTAGGVSRSSSETKVFRNMYGIDDEEVPAAQSEDRDLLAMPLVDEPEEDLMDPQITNPFILAKVNALVKPLNLSSSNSFTATSMRLGGPHNSAIPEENEEVIAQPQRQSNPLPSPSPSPERHTPSQNPGPPNRPWKSRQIQSEDNADDLLSPISLQHGTQPARPTLLDDWARSVNSSSPQREPSSLVEVRRSEPINVHTRTTTDRTVDGIQKRSPSKRPIGLSSTRQPAFRTPFKKNCSVQDSLPSIRGEAREAHITESTMQQSERVSPVELGNPKLPGFERPRVLFDTELEEIMDFEHRKRSTILEHREKTRVAKAKKTSKRNEQLDDGHAFQVPARSEDAGLSSTDQDASYGSKFGHGEDDSVDIPAQPSSSSYTQNPHWNRFKKAARDPEGRGAEKVVGENCDAGDDRPEPDDCIVQKPDEKSQIEHRTTLSAKDPRAFLIRQSKEQDTTGSGNKQKKVSTAKLPFETIEPGMATYTYIGVIGPDVEVERVRQQLNEQSRRLDKIDEYMRSGRISSGVSEAEISPDVLQQWESKIRQLLENPNMGRSERFQGNEVL